MPRISGNPAGGSDLIVYPIDHMRETAAKLLAQAGDSQAQHDALWQQIQDYVEQDFDPGWRESMRECLTPYVARLQASYDWQLNLASALFDAIDAIEGNENTTSQSFVPHRSQQHM